MCVCLYVYIPTKATRHPLDLQLQAVVSHQTKLLGDEDESSEEQWASTPTPTHNQYGMWGKQTGWL